MVLCVRVARGCAGLLLGAVAACTGAGSPQSTPSAAQPAPASQPAPAEHLLRLAFPPGVQRYRDDSESPGAVYDDRLDHVVDAAGSAVRLRCDARGRIGSFEVVDS